MKKICLYFEVHQPYRPRTYRFFDIGHNHNYFDDYANKNQMRRLAEKCYLPANQIILDLLNKHKGKFKIAFSISGVKRSNETIHTRSFGIISKIG